MNTVVRNRPTVMVVCEFADRDLSYITTPLQDTADWSRATPQEAIHYLKRAECLPELVVLVQDRPGEIGNEIVARMQAVAPLTAFYVVTGSWCEGETRTGRPWPGVLRCKWYEWPLRWREEVLCRKPGDLRLSSLPATYSEEERLLAHFAADEDAYKITQPKGCVIILCDLEEGRGALTDAMRSQGHSVVACRANVRLDVRDIAVVIWDTSIQMVNRASVAKIKARYQQAPLLVITTFPRPDAANAMTVAGVDAILAKPFLLADLHAEVRRISNGKEV